MKDAKLAKHDILLFRARCEESFPGVFILSANVKPMNHFVLGFRTNRERLCELHASATRNLKLVCREYQAHG